MTAAQKAAQNRFKQAVKIASGLRKKDPKLTQAEAVKKAFATIGAPAKKASPKKAAKKAPAKKAAPKKTVIKQIKKVLSENRKILPKGYDIRAGKVRVSGSAYTLRNHMETDLNILKKLHDNETVKSEKTKLKKQIDLLKKQIREQNSLIGKLY